LSAVPPQASKELMETAGWMTKIVLQEDQAPRLMEEVLLNLRVLQVPHKLLFLTKTATKASVFQL
jgi:hypothetical protein